MWRAFKIKGTVENLTIYSYIIISLFQNHIYDKGTSIGLYLQHALFTSPWVHFIYSEKNLLWQALC